METQLMSQETGKSLKSFTDVATKDILCIFWQSNTTVLC